MKYYIIKCPNIPKWKPHVYTDRAQAMARYAYLSSIARNVVMSIVVYPDTPSIPLYIACKTCDGRVAV